MGNDRSAFLFVVVGFVAVMLVIVLVIILT